MVGGGHQNERLLADQLGDLSGFFLGIARFPRITISLRGTPELATSAAVAALLHASGGCAGKHHSGAGMCR